MTHGCVAPRTGAAHLDRVGLELYSVHAAMRRDPELGTGVFDLRTFLHEVTDVAHTPCFVEQEGPAIELASAKRNWAYVESLEF